MIIVHRNGNCVPLEIQFIIALWALACFTSVRQIHFSLLLVCICVVSFCAICNILFVPSFDVFNKIFGTHAHFIFTGILLLKNYLYLYVIYKGLPLWLSWYRICVELGDLGLIPGFERSPGEGKGYPLQNLAWKIAWTI